MDDYAWLDSINPFSVREAQAGMTYPAEGSKALEPNVAQANAMRDAGLPSREILNKTQLYPGYNNQWEYISPIDMGKYDYKLDSNYALQFKPDTYKNILKDSKLDVNRPETKAYKFAVADPAVFVNPGQLGFADHKRKEIVVRAGSAAPGITNHEVAGHISRRTTNEKNYPPHTALMFQNDPDRVYRESYSEINAEIQNAIARETDINKIADVLDANWGYGNPYAPANMQEALDRSKDALSGKIPTHPTQDAMYKYTPIIQNREIRDAIKARK